MSKIEDYRPNQKGYNVEDEAHSSQLFNNLVWLTTKETATYLRRSVNAVHILASKGKLKARKFCNRLYFKREELDYLIETSHIVGG
ncbi:MAG: helix-turn-helix domain-containing protein [Oligoflexia bacterium]|nr:helix-turn-helix domain-containing protein [Oligoflexia bacterium]